MSKVAVFSVLRRRQHHHMYHDYSEDGIHICVVIHVARTRGGPSSVSLQTLLPHIGEATLQQSSEGRNGDRPS
ncbi:uncharacterized protein MYCFIDRAFT_172053 [Pseudocercospora fijiensis CIRAD86]|uniref:Uncharacterized protein n=1 Tax=Pseudocercospora fijiensis (strain CIRAD86) TaxID=383855 RepID=M2Z928_PSEFD|nr:uncharacterized protein MYCFIDRAFT_172053 [Pseudocercospora fijiensis CIRAD86]EME86275.1 hypothetical protein MYCFIDRAFT_172053 [Pseudocercospora fijiensis CIRAD86]